MSIGSNGSVIFASLAFVTAVEIVLGIPVYLLGWAFIHFTCENVGNSLQLSKHYINKSYITLNKDAMISPNESGHLG